MDNINPLPLYNNNPDYPDEHIKTIYDKWRNRKFNIELPIHVFGTGSEGNSVFLKPEHTLIDLGLPYKRSTEYDVNFFLDVDYLILTHHHGDHLNPSTLYKILKSYPNVKVLISDFMFEYITSKHYKPVLKKRVDINGNTIYRTGTNGLPNKSRPEYELDPLTNEPIVVDLPWRTKFMEFSSRFIPAKPMNLKTHTNEEFLFHPLTTKHGDIINIAIQIYHAKYNLKLLYSSDLDNLHGATSFTDFKGDIQRVDGMSQTNFYNCVLLEANYDEQLIEDWKESHIKAIKEKNLPREYEDREINNVIVRSQGNLRHISEQETFAYIQEHLTDNGLFIPLHASKTFGTLLQD